MVPAVTMPADRGEASEAAPILGNLSQAWVFTATGWASCHTQVENPPKR
jgi:hypothetical protein